MSTSTEDVGVWLGRYVDAWTSNDRSEIEGLFTPDAVYHAEPYDEPLVGATAIAEAWLAEPDEPWMWAATYAPLLVSGNVGVGAGTSTYYAVGGAVENVFHNIFVLTFAEDGRCSEYREWYMREPTAADAGGNAATGSDEA
jgi:ketosteroid isomerase-like protein